MKDKTVTVYVNTEEFEVPKDEELAYEAVTKLAYPELANDAKASFTVSYRRGPSKHEQGRLTKGESVKVKEKMIFDVTPTTRS